MENLVSGLKHFFSSTQRRAMFAVAVFVVGVWPIPAVYANQMESRIAKACAGPWQELNRLLAQTEASGNIVDYLSNGIKFANLATYEEPDIQDQKCFDRVSADFVSTNRTLLKSFEEFQRLSDSGPVSSQPFGIPYWSNADGRSAFVPICTAPSLFPMRLSTTCEYVSTFRIRPQQYLAP